MSRPVPLLVAALVLGSACASRGASSEVAELPIASSSTVGGPPRQDLPRARTSTAFGEDAAPEVLLSGASGSEADELDSGSSVRALTPKQAAIPRPSPRLEAAACLVEEDVAAMRALAGGPKRSTREFAVALARPIQEGDRLVAEIHVELARRGVPAKPRARDGCRAEPPELLAALRAVVGQAPRHASRAADGLSYERGLARLRRELEDRDGLPKER